MNSRLKTGDMPELANKIFTRIENLIGLKVKFILLEALNYFEATRGLIDDIFFCRYKPTKSASILIFGYNKHFKCATFNTGGRLIKYMKINYLQSIIHSTMCRDEQKKVYSSMKMIALYLAKLTNGIQVPISYFFAC